MGASESTTAPHLDAHACAALLRQPQVFLLALVEPSLQMNFPAEQCHMPPFLPEHGLLAAWLAKGPAQTISTVKSLVRTADFMNLPPVVSPSIYVPQSCVDVPAFKILP
ncbi:MAG: hypothetical protein ABWY08_17250 [Comamonas sp.]